MGVYSGHARETVEMQIVDIMAIFGWDYETYRQQPQWVIDHVLAKGFARQRHAKFTKLKEQQRHGR
jgi:hypothetical protein